MQNETAYWLWHIHMVCGRVKKQEAINRIQKSSYLWGKRKKKVGGGMAWWECFPDINSITFLKLQGASRQWYSGRKE